MKHTLVASDLSPESLGPCKTMLALGSVAEAVIRHARVPVITFPRDKE
ncbi:MAG: universal stress protein [bacterium]|jgi:nucleotide-binding universal stress UspA family protein|nr:universal stress protein [Planctomycetota bacterium]HIL52996.1 universal stress protein [Planctomycetota bacterium]